MGKNARANPGMAVIRQLAEIRHLAGFPQQAHTRCSIGQAANFFFPHQHGKRDVVHRIMALGKARQGRRRTKAIEQCLDRGKIQIRIAPSKRLQRFKRMRFDLGDDLIIQCRRIRRGAESAIAHAAPGAASDLRDFLCRQRAWLMAIKLVQRGECHMVHIHIEAHADGICRDQEIHFPVLIERDLRIARARRKPSHHHGATATPAAHRFGNGVDFLSAEGDDGGTRRQPR